MWRVFSAFSLDFTGITPKKIQEKMIQSMISNRKLSKSEVNQDD